VWRSDNSSGAFALTRKFKKQKRGRFSTTWKTLMRPSSSRRNSCACGGSGLCGIECPLQSLLNHRWSSEMHDGIRILALRSYRGGTKGLSLRIRRLTCSLRRLLPRPKPRCEAERLEVRSRRIDPKKRPFARPVRRCLLRGAARRQACACCFGVGSG
jgi:hypothetical protein